MSYKFNHLILAYGSNLNQHDWGKFCRRHGYPVDILQFEETVKIPDYKLVFDWYSSSRKGGAANIKRAVGYYVEAVLFSTNDQGIQALRQKEGHPYAYHETEVIALKNDGSEVKIVLKKVIFIKFIKRVAIFEKGSDPYKSLGKLIVENID